MFSLIYILYPCFVFPNIKCFSTQDLIFSASGREDFDVRTLGRGRPFFIKICDPKITKISSEQFAAVEKEINETSLIKIRDLQFIDKKDLILIKKGEQFKRKTYRALCVVEKTDNLDNYITVMNNIGKLTLEQKTPLRVYHRRSADIRKRNIYKMKARRIAGTFISLMKNQLNFKFQEKTACLN